MFRLSYTCDIRPENTDKLFAYRAAQKSCRDAAVDSARKSEDNRIVTDGFPHFFDFSFDIIAEVVICRRLADVKQKIAQHLLPLDG